MSSIAYNGSREITELAITDSKGKEVYTWRKEIVKGNRLDLGLSEQQRQLLEAELKRTGVDMKAVQERYKIEDPNKISGEIYNKVMAALVRTKSSSAA